MARRGIVWGLIVLVFGAVTVVTGLPGFRFNRDLAAARRDGLWTSTTQIQAATDGPKPVEDATPQILAAIRKSKERPLPSSLSKARNQALKGRATQAEAKGLRTYCIKNADLFALWRDATSRPRLAFARRWEEGEWLLEPEWADIKNATLLLVAAANLGLDSEANLLAAARLSALTRQNPTAVSQLVGVVLGRATLSSAKRLGLEAETELALGPPTDVRRLVDPYLAWYLEASKNVNDPAWYRKMGTFERGPSLWDKFKRFDPGDSRAKTEMIDLWRKMTREFPKDRTDARRIREVLQRFLPRIDAIISQQPGLQRWFSGPRELLAPLEELARFQDERRAALGKPVVESK